MSTGNATVVRDDVVITYPHREEPIVQATRATVVLLLIVSAALVLIVTVGGWDQLEGMYPVDLAYVIVYLTLAYFAFRWNRGILPVGAALAVLLGVFAHAGMQAVGQGLQPLTVTDLFGELEHFLFGHARHGIADVVRNRP
jgi:hypothetical protein